MDGEKIESGGEAHKPTFTKEELASISDVTVSELPHISRADMSGTPGKPNTKAEAPADKADAAPEKTDEDASPAAPSAARLAELQALQRSDPDLYASQEVQEELATLIKAQLEGGLAETPTKAEDRPKVEDLAEDYLPETYAEYGIPSHPSGEPRSEIDQRLIDGALKKWHAAGWEQRHVTAALEALDEAEAEAAALLDEATTARQGAHTAELKQAFGDTYEQDVAAANAWVTQHLDPIFPGGAKTLMSLRLPDGCMACISAAAGNEAAPAGAVSGVRPASGIEALLARKAELMALMHRPDDGKAYKAAQPELTRIITELNSMGR
jgi:hypothetical protein